MWNFKNYTNKQLFNLSLESESESFAEDSEVRKLVEQLGQFNVTNLVILKCELLKEITDRWFSLELARTEKYDNIKRSFRGK